MALSSLAAACGAGGPVEVPSRTYFVGGNVSGLRGTGLVLQNNGTDDVRVAADGAFRFPGALPTARSFMVTVKSRPSTPSQTCAISNGTGTVGTADVTNVTVTCVTDPAPRHSVGGAVSGLVGVGLALQNNGADDLQVNADGPFTFPGTIPEAGGYLVTVRSQPTAPTQVCGVVGGAGTVGAVNVTDVVVTCVTGAPTLHLVGGTVTGLAGGSLVLQNNAGDPLPVTSNGAFAFATKVPLNGTYLVTVKTQPYRPFQTCTVSAGSGSVSGDVTSVGVSCVANPSAIVSIAAGPYHAAAVKADGALWVWGSNSCGQVGDGTTTERPIPVLIGSGYASVTAGWSATVAVKTDGTLWAWGCNGGYLGDGTSANRSAPVQIETGFAAVAGKYATFIGLKTDGTIWAWGSNTHGQVGDGTTDSAVRPVQVGSGFVSVAAGGAHSMALTADGVLWAWGQDLSGELGDGGTTDQHSPKLVQQGIASVDGGMAATVALKPDGSVWTWGANYSGALGDGTMVAQHGPEQIATGFEFVAAGSSRGLALKAGGALWAWGGNSGALGDGTYQSRYAPVYVDEGYVSVATGWGSFSMGVKSDGALWTWGENIHGQLGDGTLTSQLRPKAVVF